jgi:UDP-N-acetyl-D-mannosaminuronic acid dehydrogenase
MRVSVLGMGYIGLPTSIILAMNGYDVNGFDVNPNVVATLESGRIHIREKGLSDMLLQALKLGRLKVSDCLNEADIYLISVPTPFKEDEDEKIADLSYVDSATRFVAKLLKAGDLVVLESTVPPGTTARMTDMLEKESGLGREEFYTAHCPERVLPGDMIRELENNSRIIGAEREESAQTAKELYSSFVKSGEIFITKDVTAEMCKLVENSYRDVNIAFANELSEICEKMNIDVMELISLANMHPRVNILNPGVGVGGHCIAVDPWFIVERFPKEANLIRQARTTNDGKPYWTADLIEKNIGADRSRTIGILGLAYKPDIDDFRESPSIRLAHILKERGYDVIACEPNADEGVSAIEDIRLKSLDDVLSEADIVVMTLNHREFTERIEEIKNVKSIIL